MDIKNYIENINKLYYIDNIKTSKKYKKKHRKEVIDYTNKLTPITDAAFKEIIITYLLGPDWYTTDPLDNEQINAIALEDIIRKYKGF